MNILNETIFNEIVRSGDSMIVEYYEDSLRDIIDNVLSAIDECLVDSFGDGHTLHQYYQETNVYYNQNECEPDDDCLLTLWELFDDLPMLIAGSMQGSGIGIWQILPRTVKLPNLHKLV